MKKLLVTKRFQFGFTLIELLIVVAIIVILISIGAVSYSTVNRNARDAQRKSDLKKIQLALEQYYSDNGSYPDEQGPHAPTYDWDPYVLNHPQDKPDEMTCDITSKKSDGTEGAIIRQHVGTSFTCGSTTYMSIIPGDPSTGWSYFYEIHEHPGHIPPPPIAPEDIGMCDLPYTKYIFPPPHGHCQMYTLWARLENSNDPEVIRTTSDPICKNGLFNENDLVNGGYNYCVHPIK